MVAVPIPADWPPSVSVLLCWPQGNGLAQSVGLAPSHTSFLQLLLLPLHLEHLQILRSVDKGVCGQMLQPTQPYTYLITSYMHKDHMFTHTTCAYNVHTQVTYLRIWMWRIYEPGCSHKVDIRRRLTTLHCLIIRAHNMVETREQLRVSGDLQCVGVLCRTRGQC